MYPVAQGVCEVIAVYMEVARPLWKEMFHSHLLCVVTGVVNNLY